jgi:hypothetical protein
MLEQLKIEVTQKISQKSHCSLLQEIKDLKNQAKCLFEK